MSWGATIALIAGGLIAVALIALSLWRWSDMRAADRVWHGLAATADSAGAARFDPAMVDGLPEPARRYFLYTIAPGTPLSTVAEIGLTGQIGLGDRAEPNYREMTAEQILAVPQGLVWRLRAGSIAGSDVATQTRSWTRFWLAGLLPLVRDGGPDHLVSSFGRVAAEGVFWVPAAYLPGPDVTWEAVDGETARVTLRQGEMEQAITLTVAEDGRPLRVVIDRWSDVNPEGLFRRQPFGGDLSEFRAFGGYTLPTRVDGGNHIGTDDYFPFYRARVKSIRFLP